MNFCCIFSPENPVNDSCSIIIHNCKAIWQVEKKTNSIVGVAHLFFICSDYYSPVFQKPMICANETFSYFSSVHFETLGYHILTSIELPLHVFAGFIILCRTPAKMQSVKWALFNLHIWSSSLDISISLLATPYILFPEIAGYPFGLLAWLGVPAKYLTWFLVAQVGSKLTEKWLTQTTQTTVMLNSMAVLYENRYSCLVRSSNFWRRARISYLAVAYFVALFYIVPFMTQIPNQEGAVAQTLKVRIPEKTFNSPSSESSRNQMRLRWSSLCLHSGTTCFRNRYNDKANRRVHLDDHSRRHDIPNSPWEHWELIVAEHSETAEEVLRDSHHSDFDPFHRRPSATMLLCLFNDSELFQSKYVNQPKYYMRNLKWLRNQFPFGHYVSMRTKCGLHVAHSKNSRVKLRL